MKRQKRRAVFLDRDGTISEEYGYANHISRFQMFPFAAAAIRRLNEAEIPVIVVTNQSGVARGYFGEELVASIHERMRYELAAAGAHVDGVYYLSARARRWLHLPQAGSRECWSRRRGSTTCKSRVPRW